MDTWKPIQNFPGYSASPDGSIMNIRTQRIQKPTLNKNGCLKVGLYKDRKRYNVRVRRVIAETFLGEHPGMDVRHKDGDQQNVSADNLEWCTRSELIKAAYDRGSKTPRRAKN